MRVAQGWRSLRVLSVLVSLTALITLATPLAHADVRYAYDPAGRLVQVVAADGSVAIYNYDAAGNITAIERLSAGQLALTTFAPTAGAPGTQVTLHGNGFSATASANAVSFNGSSANVVSATPNQLVVTVPAGATTGSISVSVAAATVTSQQSFTVQARPTISGFSPTVANPGGPVTVSGTHFSPVANAAPRVTVGPSAPSVSSFSSTQLTFPAPKNGGIISVETPFGYAATVSRLIVVPTAIVAANVVSSAVAVPGGSAQPLSVPQASKYGVLAFDTTAGQYLSVLLTSFTTVPSNASLNYQVISPALTTVASGTVSATNASIHLPKTALDGTYVVAFTSASATFQLSAQVDINPRFPLTASSLAVATNLAAQSRRFVFAATAGESIGVGLANLVTAPAATNVLFTVTRPDGAVIDTSGSCLTANPGSGCNVWRPNVPQTGDYLIIVTPSAPATMSFDLSVSRPVTLSPTSGTATNFNLPVWGQWALINFTAASSEDASITLSSLATTPANQNASLIVLDPNWNQVTQLVGTGARDYNMTNLAAGTYRVVVIPWYGANASGTIKVTWGARVSGTVQANGSTTHFSTGVPGQSVYVTFAGTAGQGIGVGLNNLVTSSGNATFSVTRPNGQSLTTSGACATSNPGGGCNVWWGSLPETGNYLITVTPSSMQGTMSFDLAVSLPQLVTATSGAAANVSLPVWGQWGLINFTTTAGQDAAVELTSLVTTPANQNATLFVYDPNWNEVANLVGNGARSRAFPNLVAGTYKIVVIPWYGANASFTVKATWGDPLSATVPVNGSSNHFATTILGQSGSFTFAATSGQGVGIGLNNLVTSSGNATVTLIRPDGVVMTTSGTCSASNPGGGCNIFWGALPQTGNYRLSVVPTDTATMSFDLSLSSPGGNAMTLGTPENLNLSSWGQWALRTFTLGASQSVAITLDTVATSPSNQNVSVIIYDANWNQLTTSASTGSRTDHLNLGAGTYRIAVVPWYGAVATARLSVN